MPKRKKTPNWTRTNVAWERKVLVWERMALGDNDSQLEKWLDGQQDAKGDSLHLDRDTVALIREELRILPSEIAAHLPAVVAPYWKSISTQVANGNPSKSTCLIGEEEAAALAHTFSVLVGVDWLITDSADLRTILDQTLDRVARSYRIDSDRASLLYPFVVEDNPAGTGYIVSGHPQICEFVGQLLRGETPDIARLHDMQPMWREFAPKF